MKVNNATETGKYRLYFILSIMIILVALAFMILDKIDLPNIVILILGLFSFIYILIKKPYFVQFETNHKEIVIKFYSAIPIFRKPKAIKIPINKLVKYEIIKKNIKEFLIVYIKTNKKLAKYPPVPLSIVSQEMKDKMTKELNYILKVNSV